MIFLSIVNIIKENIGIVKFFELTFLKFIKMYYGEDICFDDVTSIEWTRIGHFIRWSYYSYSYAPVLFIESVVIHSLVDKKH